MKTFFNKYKSKIKKFLYSLPVFVVSFLLTFGFSVSAETVYNMPFSQPLASDTAGYVECLMSNGNIYVYFFQSVGRSTNQAYVDVSPTSLKLTLNDNSSNTDSNRISLVYGFMRIPNNYYGIYSSVGETTSMVQNMWVPDWCTIVSVKAYGFVRLYATNVETGSNWQVIYGSDTVVVNQLNALVSAITSQNQQVIENADKNASAIQSNADKNASDIQSNSDKNTDIITNGGSDYGTVDKDTSNDYMSKEQELDAATSMSRENTVSLFSNFGSFFLNSKLAKGLTGTTAIMKEFFGISWLSDMANFGLILGAFAFVIGAGVLAGGIHRQKVISERRSQKVFSERRSSRGGK